MFPPRVDDDVHYFQSAGDRLAGMQNADPTKPLHGVVTVVHGDRLVNVTVVDERGTQWKCLSVPLKHPEDDIPVHAAAWCMPAPHYGRVRPPEPTPHPLHAANAEFNETGVHPALKGVEPIVDEPAAEAPKPVHFTDHLDLDGTWKPREPEPPAISEVQVIEETDVGTLDAITLPGALEAITEPTGDADA